MDDGTSSAMAARRLRALRLTGPPCATPEEAIGHLGVVQAQDYGPAKWSVGARVAGATDAGVEKALAAGRILRTHVLRPTWHFVLPADIRWLLAATAPRVKARDARRYAQLGLDEGTLRRSAGALIAALRGGDQLTRAEAASVLTAAGIGVDGQRLAYLLMHAELDALICSGPRRGKQHTYVLLDERAPDARDMPRDEALAELARRYFTSHGPATAKDFAGWATLTLAEARAALEVAGEDLQSEEVAGLRCWSAARASGTAVRRRPALRSPVVHLLQGYDEYIMGYSETKAVLQRPGAGWDPVTPPVFTLVIMLDGRVAGFWRRTVRKDRLTVEAALLEPLDAAQTAALEAEAGRYGEFLGLPAELVVTG